MCSLAIVACSIVLSLFPRAAEAVPVGGAVILGFGESYPGDGGIALHRGADVACAEGEDVVSPQAGEVSFVGRVPSAAGGTMLVVTVVTTHGNLTFMPLADAVVARGQRVDVGQRLGTASASGDPSSPVTHLHVGLKRAGMYLDPSEVLGLLSQTVQQGAEDMVPAGAAAPEGESPVARTTGAAGSVAPSLSAGRQTRSVRTGAGDAMPEGVTLASTARAAQPSAQGADAMPMGDVAGAVRAPVAAGARAPQGASALPGVGLPTAYAPPASPLSAAADVLVDALPAPAGVSPRGVAALVASILAGVSLLARRTLRRRVISSPVSDRLGYLLQHLKAGDTLRGLTSCSGPLPSQSRGRIAQGR